MFGGGGGAIESVKSYVTVPAVDSTLLRGVYVSIYFNNIDKAFEQRAFYERNTFNFRSIIKSYFGVGFDDFCGRSKRQIILFVVV